MSDICSIISLIQNRIEIYGSDIDVIRDLDFVKVCLVYSSSYHWSKKIAAVAADSNLLSVLKWLLEYNNKIVPLLKNSVSCPLNCNISFIAAKRGYLDILQWTVSIGIKLDGYVLCLAYEYEQDHIFQWAIQNYCPIGKYLIFTLIDDLKFDILKTALIKHYNIDYDDCLHYTNSKLYSHYLNREFPITTKDIIKTKQIKHFLVWLTELTNV